MARPPITPEKKAAMRSEIRAAALRVINRLKLSPGDARGLEQVTVREVIKEANISIGTFYKYFESREDLGQSLWAEPVDKLRSKMEADFDLSVGPETAIRTLLEHYVTFLLKNPRVFKGAFLHVRPEHHPKPERMDLEAETFYRNLVRAFEDGQEQGAFRSFDARDMAQLFWAAIHGSLALPVNLDRFEFDDSQTLSSKMIEALMDLIRA